MSMDSEKSLAPAGSTEGAVKASPRGELDFLGAPPFLRGAEGKAQ
jgi:hypothetical protein